MFVDEYHDTSWTRGRCPAAPPHMLNPAKRLVFIWKFVGGAGHDSAPGTKNNHLRVVVVLKSGVFRMMFIFGFRRVVYNFFIQKLPL